MNERRHHERVRAILGARIIFNNNSSTIDCRISNISSGGAKLALSGAVALPSEFDVHIPQKGCTFRARLRWRKANAIGVDFLREETHEAPVDDVVARLRELESGIELLRKRLLELELEKAGGSRVRTVA